MYQSLIHSPLYLLIQQKHQCMQSLLSVWEHFSVALVNCFFMQSTSKTRASVSVDGPLCHFDRFLRSLRKPIAVSQWRSDIKTGVTFAEFCLYLYHFY